MAIGRINMHTEYAKIQIHTTNPSIKMKQQNAQIQIQSELPRVIIDQSECFNTSGLKSNSVLAKDSANKGYQDLLNFIQTTVNDGDRMAAIEKGGDPFIDIALRNAYPEHEFNVVSMPSARPKIEVTGSLEIDFTPKILGVHNGVQIDVRLGDIDTRYIPGSLKIDYRV